MSENLHITEKPVDITAIARKLLLLPKNTDDKRRNALSELLNEVSWAMEFNLDLLKENGPRSRFILYESDADIFREFYDLAVSKEGKCGRKKDFKGAGAEAISKFIRILNRLMEHAGVDEEKRNNEVRRLIEYTDHVVMVDLIQKKTHDFDYDIENHFFAVGGENADAQYFNVSDKQVFLEFILGNIDADPRDIRGVYLSFREAKQEWLLWDLFQSAPVKPRSNKSAHRTGREWREKMKQLDERLQTDPEYTKAMTEYRDINLGLGRLKDKKKLKDLEATINSKHEKIAAEVLDGFIEADETTASKEQTMSNAEYEERNYEIGQLCMAKAIDVYEKNRSRILAKPLLLSLADDFSVLYAEKYGEYFLSKRG